MIPLNFRQALCGPLRDPSAAVDALHRQGWQARSDVAAWPLSLPLDWAADPFEDRNWRYQLNSWRPLAPLITAHDKLGDPALLREVIDLILDWERHETTHPDDALLWNDMGSGIRASKLAYVLTQPDLADPLFDDAREALVALGRRHLARLRDRSFIGESNHGLFQVHGTMALCKALPNAPEADGGEAYAEAVFTDLLHQQFGFEGVHLEHSPGYHHFALKTIKKFAATGWYDAMPEVTRIIDAAQAVLPWFILPDGRMSAIGDSSRAVVRTKASGGTRTRARLFGEAGYAVIRSGRLAKPARASMLIITGGHHSNVHKHADELSFEWFARGRHIIVDTGKYTYSRARWRAYTDGASAHNAIHLTEERANNGVRHAEPVGGMLTHLAPLERCWLVQGAFERPRLGVAHARTILYRTHRQVILLDRVRCDDVRRMTAWLHLAPDLEAVAEQGGWTFPGGRIDYVTEGEAARRRYRGETDPEIQGWMATSYHHRTENDALGLTLVGREVRLATVISLGEVPAPDIRITPQGFSVSIEGELAFEGDADTPPS
jgi:hypothetical protein